MVFLVEHLTDWGEEKLVSRCASTINGPILDRLKSFFSPKKAEKKFRTKLKLVLEVVGSNPAGYCPFFFSLYH